MFFFDMLPDIGQDVSEKHITQNIIDMEVNIN